MTERVDGFLPLRDYAVLGDGRTCALVGSDGDIDWWALPRMDSDPTFGAVLDPDRGGHIRLRPRDPFSSTRCYLDGGGVLATEFRTDTGTVRVTDALTLDGGSPLPWSELARVVEVLDGEVPMTWRVQPGDRFAISTPYLRSVGDRPLIAVGGQQLAVITEGLGQPDDLEGGVCGAFVARGDSPALLAIISTDGEPVPGPDPDDVRRRVNETREHWIHARSLVSYDGPWREAVIRSALVHRQLTLSSTGAVQAAATTSLPERVGGARNFDYRFSWIRDTAFALNALTSLGLRPEVHSSLSYLLHAVAQTAPDLKVCYTMSGEPPPDGVTRVQLWKGYRNSTPVQTGNRAGSQRQLGIYGDLLECITHYAERGNVLDGATGALVSQVADQVSQQWLEPDAGLWELGNQEHYTSSKLGCWAALDRAIRLADAGQVPDDQVPRWRQVADEIRDYINTRCWSETKQSYTEHAGTDALDCAVLLVARTHFCDADDPRLRTTIEAIRRELAAGGPLLYRYSGMEDEEGAFVACSFWLIEALVHSGRVDEALPLMEQMVGLCNDVGLLSEEIDPTTHELLGNIPQALSHLALIGAATTLQSALSGATAPR